MANSMSRTSRLRWMLVLLVAFVGLDQATKYYAVTHWDGLHEQSLLGGILRIKLAKNDGAFLSMLGNQSPTVRFAVLVIGNAIGMTVLAVILLRSSQIDRWTFFAWALVFVGGIGNLIDRVLIRAVIDFLILGYGPIHTGIFNVADMAITAGFLMLVPQIFMPQKSDKDAATSSESPPAANPGTST